MLIFHLKPLPQQLQLFPVPCKTQAVRHYHFWKWACICLSYTQAISGQKPYLSSHHPVFTFKQWRGSKATSHAPEHIVGGELPGRIARFLPIWHVIPCSTTRGSFADCWVGQPSTGTSLNHFSLGLTEDLESKQEHILDAALFVPTLSTFVLQMFAFARNNGAGPRCFLAQWLRLGGLCHMKSRAQMGSCGTSVVTDCQSSLLWTWSNTVNWCHPYLAFTSQPCPLRSCQAYTVKEATILSWLWKLLKWNQLVIF